jgi:hypothetical protein
MTDQRHATDDHAPDYYAPEPSIPTSHGSFVLGEDTVIVYGEENSEQWLWSDAAVERTENR